MKLITKEWSDAKENSKCFIKNKLRLRYRSLMISLFVVVRSMRKKAT